MLYRRARIAGGTYFFTVVTHRRQALFKDEADVARLRESFLRVMERHPFEIDAMVVLPDHMHCMWTLPEGDQDFSTRWRLIKTLWSLGVATGREEPASRSREAKKERGLWQRRFWEHLIRDERDYLRHVEYIHYNPVKHGLVNAPREWPHSSFHRHVRQGVVDIGWCAETKPSFPDDVGFE
jgi:putative transposase